MIYLNRDFNELWAGKDPFEQVALLDGEVLRQVKSRKTLRFELGRNTYFAKIYRGAGWREVIKNLAMLKMPVLSVRNEYEGIRRLKNLGIAAPDIAAFGLRGKNPANIESFIITKDLANSISLEDFCRNWKASPPPSPLKKALVEHVAHISRTMHHAGMNHRDFYICHFLLDISRGYKNLDPQNIQLSLLDLHRSQTRDKTPVRWIVKDIAGLWFSAMDIGLTRRDIFRFVRSYAGVPLRQTLIENKGFWRAVRRRAIRTYRREFGSPPVLPI